MNHSARILPVAVLVCLTGFAWSLEPWRAVALDRVEVRRNGQSSDVAGRVLVTASDGGLLFLATDGVIWSIQPEEIGAHTTDDEPFESLPAVDLGKELLKRLPPGFEVHTTKNYIICHNTSKAYAQWCGALFERLYLAFTNFWSRKGFEITKPEFPLVAVVFADKPAYAAFARPELGDGVESIIGYYSLQTNRMTMFDLTGIEAARQTSRSSTSAQQINAVLSRPEAERTVATVIHESTHQIAFNCGLQTRYADIPLWVSEGVAVYFETPDLQSAAGWRTIGAVNRFRLGVFRDYLSRRPQNSLKTLLADDQRFRDSKLAGDAYAEAWALNYFLLRQRPDEYLSYFQMLAKKPVLVNDDPEARLRDFQACFGENLGKLDADFVRYLSQVK